MKTPRHQLSVLSALEASPQGQDARRLCARVAEHWAIDALHLRRTGQDIPQFRPCSFDPPADGAPPDALPALT
ncbi:MAG: hypothetical protein H6811_10650 [Phycisphaeraceae bacterium]|nr:hypothetical protein [Phycisphaeraceae bacterium]